MNLPVLRLPLLALILFQAPCELPAQMLSPVQLAEDYDIFCRALREVHPGLHRFTPAVETDRRMQEAGDRLVDSMSAVQFYRLLAPVVAGDFLFPGFGANPRGQRSGPQDSVNINFVTTIEYVLHDNLYRHQSIITHRHPEPPRVGKCEGGEARPHGRARRAGILLKSEANPNNIRLRNTRSFGANPRGRRSGPQDCGFFVILWN